MASGCPVINTRDPVQRRLLGQPAREDGPDRAGRRPGRPGRRRQPPGLTEPGLRDRLAAAARAPRDRRVRPPRDGRAEPGHLSAGARHRRSEFDDSAPGQAVRPPARPAGLSREVMSTPIRVLHCDGREPLRRGRDPPADARPAPRGDSRDGPGVRRLLRGAAGDELAGRRGAGPPARPGAVQPALDRLAGSATAAPAAQGPAVRRGRLPRLLAACAARPGRPTAGPAAGLLAARPGRWLPLGRACRRGTPPDLAIVNSQATAGTLPKLFPGGPHEVLYYPVSPPGRLEPTTREDVRRELATPDGATVIVQASRLERYKGHSLLLDALGRLRDRTGLGGLDRGGGPAAPRADLPGGVAGPGARLGDRRPGPVPRPAARRPPPAGRRRPATASRTPAPSRSASPSSRRSTPVGRW